MNNKPLAIFLICLFILQFPNSIYCSGKNEDRMNPIWYKEYLITSSKNIHENAITDIIETQYGTYIIGYANTQSNFESFLGRIDNMGNIIWTKYYWKYPEYSNSSLKNVKFEKIYFYNESLYVIGTSNNDLYDGKEEIVLFHLDLFGNELWNDTWTSRSDYYIELTGFDYFNNNFYIVGILHSLNSSNHNTALLISISIFGTINWYNLWNEKSYMEFATGVKAYSKEIIVSGFRRYWNLTTDYAEYIIRSYSNTGNLNWEKSQNATLSAPYVKSAHHNNQIIFLVLQGYYPNFEIANFNSSGNLIWNKTDNSSQFRPNDILIKNEYFYLIGASEGIELRNYSMIDFNIKSKKVYNDTGFWMGYSIRADDNFLYIFGKRDIPDVKTFIIKTDYNGSNFSPMDLQIDAKISKVKIHPNEIVNINVHVNSMKIPIEDVEIKIEFHSILNISNINGRTLLDGNFPTLLFVPQTDLNTTIKIIVFILCSKTGYLSNSTIMEIDVIPKLSIFLEILPEKISIFPGEKIFIDVRATDGIYTLNNISINISIIGKGEYFSSSNITNKTGVLRFILLANKDSGGSKINIRVIGNNNDFNSGSSELSISVHRKNKVSGLNVNPILLLLVILIILISILLIYFENKKK